jgi:exonuclease VII small subunit
MKEYVDIVELNKRVKSLESLTLSLKEEVKVLTEALETYLISKELATIVKSLKTGRRFEQLESTI